MSASQYTVTGSVPQNVRGNGYPSAVTVYNTSTTAILYLSEQPANNGFPLNPGSTISWDEGKPLYLYTDAGQSITVSLVDNGGSMTDAKAIAGQIIAGGLATDIAAAISISGAPSINDKVVLSDTTFVGAIGGNFVNLTGLTTYQSITVIVRETGVAGALVPVARVNTLTWNGTGGFATAIESFVTQDDKGSVTSKGTVTYTTSVKDSTLALFLAPNGLSGQDIHVAVIGSYTVVPVPTYFNKSAYSGVSGVGVISGSGDDGLTQWFVAIKAAGPATFEYPPSKNGPCTITLTFSTVTVTGYISVGDTSVNADYAIFTLPVSGVQGTLTQTIYLPSRPLRFTANGALAATNLRFTITYPY